MNIPAIKIGQRTQIAVAAAVCAIPVVALAVYLRTPDFPMDDAYIVQHLVESLRAGADIRFIGTPPLVGATGPSQVLLITALSVAMPVAGRSSSSLGLTRFFMPRARFIWRSGSGRGRRRPRDCALSVLAGMSAYHFFNGLETSLAMTAVIWSLILFFDPIPAKRWRFALLGLMPYIRPELATLTPPSQTAMAGR